MVIGVLGEYEKIREQIERFNREVEIVNMFLEKNKERHLDILIINTLKDFENKYVNLEKESFIIINDDFKKGIISKDNAVVIFYGFSQESNITVSSVSDDKICFCVQKPIPLKNNFYLIEQEIPIRKINSDIYSVLASLTGLIISDFLLLKEGKKE